MNLPENVRLGSEVYKSLTFNLAKQPAQTGEKTEASKLKKHGSATFRKPPYIQFNVTDYFADHRVQRMKAEARGWYTNMLFNSWNKSSAPCMIPNDADSIHEYAGIDKEDAEEIQRFTASGWRILRCFDTSDDGKYIYNKRLLREYETLLGHRLRIAASVKKTLAGKRKHASNIPGEVKTGKPQVAYRSTSQSESESESEIIQKQKPSSEQTALGGDTENNFWEKVRKTDTCADNMRDAISKGRKNCAATADPRHASIREVIQKLHMEKFKGVKCPWDGSEAQALSKLLKANPSWTVEDACRMVENRFLSEGVAGTRPRVWIPRLSDWTGGPLDRFNKRMGGNDEQPVSKAQQRQQSNLEAAREALKRMAITASDGVG